MKIQWYPGHMAKTRRDIQEAVKLVDVVIELLDARIPLSSRNPDLDSMISGKPKLVLLNKCDLAEDGITSAWIKYFKTNGTTALAIDSITGKNINKVYQMAKEPVKEKFERKAERGIIGRPVRALVAGIPNVGKSSFINKISSRAGTKTGDKPGVTRSKQWIKVNKEFELLDTPGILWPKFDDEVVGLHLAYTRAIKDEILDPEELSAHLLEELAVLKPQAIIQRYKVEAEGTGLEMLKKIGSRRGCIISGGEIDTLRAAGIILDDYRSGKLGKITLELPPQEERGKEDGEDKR